MRFARPLGLADCLLFSLVWFLCGTLFAGPEPISDSKDYSKESAPPLQESWCQPPPPWEFRFGIPGWMAGISGDFGVKGVDTEQDVDFTDILKRLDMIAAGSLYARYHRWEIYADGQYIKLSDTAVLPGLLFDTAHVALKSAFAEGFLGYRLINCQRVVLSIFSGARYNYMRGELNIRKINDPRFPPLRNLLGIPRSLRVSGSEDWVDPVVGLSAKVRLYKPFSLYASGGFGGFDANSGSAFKLGRVGRRPAIVRASSSDWSYQVQGGLEVQLTRWMWSQLGWRYFKYDYVMGGFVNKTDLSGPIIQAGLSF
jgi:hypothetical protein